MAKVVAWARERGALVVSDECYLELGWTAEPVSVLHPDVCGGDPTGVLAVHSLSKRSNLAGYRFGFAAGDPAVIARLLEVRKHAGMMVPGPIQAAASPRCATRSTWPSSAPGTPRGASCAGSRRWARRASGSTTRSAGLYLWATRGQQLLGDRRLAGRARHPGRPRRVLRPRREPARPGRADRDRRAGRGGGRAAAAQSASDSSEISDEPPESAQSIRTAPWAGGEGDRRQPGLRRLLGEPAHRPPRQAGGWRARRASARPARTDPAISSSLIRACPAPAEGWWPTSTCQCTK